MKKLNYCELCPPLFWEYVKIEMKIMKLTLKWMLIIIDKKVYPPPTHTHTYVHTICMYRNVDKDFQDF